MHLSREFAVTVVSDTGVHEVRNGEFNQVRTGQGDELGSINAFLRSVIARTHDAYEKFNCRSWSLPDLDPFSHVILHYPALLTLLAGRDVLPKVILDTHNNEREYFESVALQTTNPIRAASLRKQADVSERLISEARGILAATISVSESDRDWVAEFCDDDTVHFVVPNNLFEYAPVPWSGRKTILYVGTLNVSMNVQALEWFRQNVWTEVQKRIPDLEFVVAGRNPDAGLVASLEQSGVRVMPNVPSLDDVYADAMFSVIPATSGSGGKIKVCEALARGVPVLTTSQGLVGQPEAIKRCCVSSDRPEDWVAAIESQLHSASRSDAEWKARVREALGASYFGNSIRQIADFMRAAPSRPEAATADRDRYSGHP